MSRACVLRLFDDFFGQSMFGSGLTPWDEQPRAFWPQIEVEQRENRLEVRADVPGLKKDDIKVEIQEHELVISGERRNESERTEGGYYRSERSYGSFARAIPLPEAANVDTVQARFDNGVLTVSIEVPGQERRRRQVEVRDASEQDTRH
jgi:HSP20 family protein